MDDKQIKSKIADGYIHFRAIIEVLGKPKEYVTESIESYVNKIDEDEDYLLAKKDLEDAEQQEGSGLYLAFAEVECLAKDVKNVTNFCFDFMPSSIEILDPDRVILETSGLTDFLNDIQGRLHAVNIGINDYKQKNKNLITNTSTLLRNFIMVILRLPTKLSTISILTGLKDPETQKLLDALIKEGKIVKQGDLYKLKNA